MKTTDENKDGFLRVRGIQQEHNFQNFVRDSNFQQVKPEESRHKSQIDVPSQQMLKQFSQLSVNGDDGYSTDSRSNTTASISSLLSSSLSSLSTYDGSHLNTLGPHNYSQTMNQNVNTLGPIQKGPTIIVNSKANLGKNGGPPIKRRSVRVEEPDNVSSLEDRIRALTTIEEEELSGMSMTGRSISARIGLDKMGVDSGVSDIQNPTTSPTDLRNSKVNVQNFATDSNYFRALPVAITALDSSNVSHKSIEKMFSPVHDRDGIRHANYQIESHEVFSPSLEGNKEGWNDYTHFFKKDCDVPLRNIDRVTKADHSGIRIRNDDGVDIQRQGSLVSSGKNGFSVNKNDSNEILNSLLCESSHDHKGPSDQGFNRVADGQGDGFFAIRNVDKHGRGHSSNEIHLLRSMQDFRSQDKSQISEQMSGHMSQKQAITLQEYIFYDQLQQQQLHQSVSHEQAHPKYIQQQAHSLSVLSDLHTNIQPPYRTSASPSISVSSMHASLCSDQAPWQPGNSIDQQHLVECQKLKQMGLERSSMDLGNIPNLQQQIRATSEQCLLAKRHAFASSADIHKLFSGQRQSTSALQISDTNCFDNVKDENNQASAMKIIRSGTYQTVQDSTKLRSSQMLKNSTISGFPQIVQDSTKPGFSQMFKNSATPETSHIVQDSLQSKPKLRVMMPSLASVREPSIDPIRTEPGIYIPPEAWTNVAFLPKSTSFVDRTYLQVHSQPVPDRLDFPTHALHRSQSVSADSNIDRSHVHCLSSGYSSESELQQIESNAETVKKLVRIQGIDKIVTNPIHEFIPLNRSIDYESNTDTDNLDEIMDRNPVYENQLMLTNTQTIDSFNQPFSPGWCSLKDSTTPQQFTPSVSVHHQLSYALFPHAELETKPPQTSLSTSSVNSNSDNNINSNTGYLGSMNNHEIMNLINKPTFVTDDITPHSNISQDYNYINKNVSNITATIFYPTQHIPYERAIPAYNSDGYHHIPSQSEHAMLHDGQSYLHYSHFDYPQQNIGGTFVQLSPVEIAHILDTPFETNIISDEQGDRLSTLV